MYKCLHCEKVIDIKEIKEKIRCPYCGYRVVIKESPKTVTRVKAE